jgi:hypothetical protein
MASSDFRSAFHHFTGSPLIGFTFTRYRGLAPHGCVAWCRDGSLPFRDGLCDHSDPSTPTGSWVLHFQVLRTVHGLRYPCAELGSRFVLLAQVGGCDAAGFLIVRTDHSLAPQGDLVVALRRSDLSFRRPPATGLLGHYPGRTHTGESITALSGHTTRSSASSGWSGSSRNTNPKTLPRSPARLSGRRFTGTATRSRALSTSTSRPAR